MRKPAKVKFSHIGQFRNVIHSVQSTAHFMGLDEDKEPIYDESHPKPTLTFKGTVKLHGSNGSVCFHKDEMWVQSRTNIIEVGEDNHGCANFVEATKEHWLALRDDIRHNYNCIDDFIITIFFEWAGKGIQSKVAISQVDKFAMIYDARFMPSLKLVKIRVVSKIPLRGEGPALGYPWKGVVYIAIFLREYWSAGVVEY